MGSRSNRPVRRSDPRRASQTRKYVARHDTAWLPRTDYARGSRRRAASPRSARRAIWVAALIACLGGAIAIIGLTDSGVHARSRRPSAAAAQAPSGHGADPAPKISLGPRPRSRNLARDLGEMIVARFAGESPSATLLARVRAGQVGGIILFGDNFSGGVAPVKAAIAELQRQARLAETWPLLIMTDQEGGAVKRIAGAPPTVAPSAMTSPTMAYAQGRATGRALRAVGVNVDLAPVADVEHASPSFLGTRAFGGSASLVAGRACAFAHGLGSAGVAYTLKHFPGLGRALTSTDNGPVTIADPAAALRTDYAAYRQCGRGTRALVMVSSAAYPALTGTQTPAVLSPEVYTHELTSAGVRAVTISDDLEAPALAGQVQPALHAINAGLDLMLYAQFEQVSGTAYSKLLADLKLGLVRPRRVIAAAAAIQQLKRTLGP
jgi:beta-N-acetylhexosaminidase